MFKELKDLIRNSVDIMVEIRNEVQVKSNIPVILSGSLGPKGDGYKVGDIKLTPKGMFMSIWGIILNKMAIFLFCSRS